MGSMVEHAQMITNKDHTIKEADDKICYFSRLVNNMQSRVKNLIAMGLEKSILLSNYDPLAESILFSGVKI